MHTLRMLPRTRSVALCAALADSPVFKPFGRADSCPQKLTLPNALRVRRAHVGLESGTLWGADAKRDANLESRAPANAWTASQLQVFVASPRFERHSLFSLPACVAAVWPAVVSVVATVAACAAASLSRPPHSS